MYIVNLKIQVFTEHLRLFVIKKRTFSLFLIGQIPNSFHE